MPVDLYRSATLLVRCVPATDTTRWVVAFDNHAEDAGLNRAGFGEAFFVGRGIAYIAVIGCGNDWYQYDDLPDALAVVRAAVAGAARVMAYGSSMGGYAALRTADAIGAHAVLALSPQYSNDPQVVPFERRWLLAGRRIAWRPALAGSIRGACRPVVIYDPRGDDGRHAALIAADLPIEAVPLAHVGHPVTSFLGSAELLQPVALAVLDGRFDRAAFLAQAQPLRRADPFYLAQLADLQPPWRAALGVTLAERALAIRPTHDYFQHILARRLEIAGRADEALPLHRAATQRSGMLEVYALPYGEALERAGDRARAIAVAREIVRRQPDAAHLHSWLADLLRRADHWRAAARHAARAAALAPHEAYFRDRLALYDPWSPRAWRRAIRETLARWQSGRKRKMEARAGIEPACKDLQSSA